MGKVICTDAEATPSKGGAIVGWLRSHDIAKMTGNCWLEGSATGAGKDGGNVNMTNAFCFNEAQYASGEVCYNLNGDQSVIGWYQTLPGDNAPVLLDPTHGQVYKNGRLHCNGDPSEDTAFSNENLGTTRDEHNMVDGFCDYCGLFFPDGLTPNADGFYEISNARRLAWFEQKVNTGELKANAILTADIDFADLMPKGANPEETQISWTPIGDWGQTRGVASAGYQGHFDGQGHTIKNFNVTASKNFFGLFGVVTAGCLIENFTITGNMYNDAWNQCGTIGFARDNSVVIRNIHSYLNITNAVNTKTIGGILGHAFTQSTVTIDRCWYSGTFTVTDNGGSDDGMYGGIFGHSYNNSSTHINITNCLFDGKLVNTAASESPISGCVMGGIAGWIGSNVPYSIENCLSIGEVTNTCAGQIAGGLQNNGASYSNNYYKGSAAFGAVAKSTNTTTLVTDEQLMSGEVCYKLNGDQTVINWYQTINEDAYPVLDNSHETVLFSEEIGYYNLVNGIPVGIKTIENGQQTTDNRIYNLAGQRLSKMQKGINIVGGHKILVK